MVLGKLITFVRSNVSIPCFGGKKTPLQAKILRSMVGADDRIFCRDGFVDFDDDSDVSDSDFSEEESDDEDLPPPPPPRAPAARGRGRGGVRGGQRGQGDRVGGVGRGGRGGAPNVQVNARVQAGLQRAAPVANRGNDPVLPMQEFLAAAL